MIYFGTTYFVFVVTYLFVTYVLRFNISLTYSYVVIYLCNARAFDGRDLSKTGKKGHCPRFPRFV